MGETMDRLVFPGGWFLGHSRHTIQGKAPASYLFDPGDHGKRPWVYLLDQGVGGVELALGDHAKDGLLLFLSQARLHIEHGNPCVQLP